MSKINPTIVTTPTMISHLRKGRKMRFTSQMLEVGSKRISSRVICNKTEVSDMSTMDEQTVEKHLIAKLFTPVHEEIEGYESSLNDKEDASFLYMQVNASTCDELDDFED
ncbi:hypothetical protein Tco_1539168 [Tanacetum coccineum]